jgi:hypothetical protein
VRDDVVRLFDLDGVAMSGHLWRAPGEVAWPSSRHCPIYVVEDRLLEWAQEAALKSESAVTYPHSV